MSRDKVGDITRMVIAAIIVAIVISGFVALSVAERPLDSYIYLLGMMGIPTVVSVITARASAKAAENSEKALTMARNTHQTLEVVEKSVNGNTTRMMNTNDDLQARLKEYERQYGELSND